jgi:hypothetical protein
MRNRLPGFAFWAVAALLALGVLASVPARAAPVYTLHGYADLSSGLPVPDGVTVDLISATTHQVFTTTVSGGSFSFGSGNTGGTLAPGWWGVWIPPQGRASLASCTNCGFLPATPNPTYAYENGTDLTTSTYPVGIGGVSLVRYTTTLSGSVSYGSGSGASGPAAGATVDVIAPTSDGFVLASATANATGYYTMLAPSGAWDVRASAGGFYNYTSVSIGGVTMTVNPTILGELAYGNVFEFSAPSTRVPVGGNATIISTSNFALDSSPMSPGFYGIGTSPGLDGGGRSYDVVVSPIGYQSVWYPLTASGTTPAKRNVYTPYTGPPANFTTTIDFRSNSFAYVNVYTNATLLNSSTFPDLPNASVGNLWEQFALDFQHSLGFNTSNFGTLVSPWLASQGPFFPASTSGFTVNGTKYGPPDVPGSYSFTATGPAPGATLDFGSPNTLPMAWSAKYNTTRGLPGGGTGTQYTISFNFRHPTHEQAFNYTVSLPAGFSLLAGTKAPTYSRLVPAGPSSTWTKFTLVSLPAPSGTSYSTATFTAIKYTTLTANVAITSSNYTFSSRNILSSAHNNYTAVAGPGQPLTFSGLPSTYPAGTNGSYYAYSFGDGGTGTANVAPGYVNHTYAAPGVYHGSLTVTSSGGVKDTTTFTVIVGNTAPTAKISTNATASEIKSAGGTTYLLLNWSRTLQINVTGSSCPIAPSLTSANVCGSANFTLSSVGFQQTAGFSASANVPVDSNWTPTFLGAGNYLTAATVGSTVVSFTGWEYTLGLTVWSGNGVAASTSLIILVRDTEKPIPAISMTDIHGKPIPSAGIEEGSNFTAPVVLSSVNSSDPHNGSIVAYTWTITDPANGSLGLKHNPINQTATGPSYSNPGPITLWLAPQSRPYTINLTATDRAGNKGSVTASLSVFANTTTRPVPSPTNLSAPKSMNDGTSYTISVNVTNTVGKLSTAVDLAVRFYLCPAGSSCTPSQRTYIGDPASVRFYTVSSNGTIGTTPIATGTLPSLAYNHTVRAVFDFTPTTVGTYDLYANATAKNTFYGELTSGANLAHVRVTLNQNPIILALEYAGIAIAAIVVIIVLIGFYRRRQGKPFFFVPVGRFGTRTTPARPGAERGTPRRRLETEDEEDEDEV